MSGWVWFVLGVVVAVLAAIDLACSMCASQTDQAQERHDGR